MSSEFPGQAIHPPPNAAQAWPRCATFLVRGRGDTILEQSLMFLLFTEVNELLQVVLVITSNDRIIADRRHVSRYTKRFPRGKALSPALAYRLLLHFFDFGSATGLGGVRRQDHRPGGLNVGGDVVIARHLGGRRFIEAEVLEVLFHEQRLSYCERLVLREGRVGLYCVACSD